MESKDLRLLISVAVVLGLLAAIPALGQAAKTADSCAILAKLALPKATITMAQPVAASEFKMPKAGPGGPGDAGGPGKPPRGMPSPYQPADTTNHIPFCRVAATSKPSGDSNIRIEVWLPLSGWNGKYLALGNFGWAGSIMYDGLLMGLESGYAAASTDAGHDDSDGGFGRFALGHPEKAIDYGYRAAHEMTLDAKAIANAFYGSAPRHSYWIGCSLGGQQGLTEAQRFPEDYDGVVVGSPANPITHLNAAQIWPALLIDEVPARYISESKFAMIHQAVLNACDTLDGVKDGVIEDPESCDFDPKALLCKGADAADCLTAPQVELMQKIYSGAVNPRTGEQIYAPTARGAELSLSAFAGKSGFPNAVGLFKNMVFQNPNWDWKTLDLDKDVAFADKVLGTVNIAVDPNLKPFFAHGGKLLMYHGWTDFSSPRESIGYFNAVVKTVGAGDAGNSIRLFNMPGMDHCLGGAGCDTFDKLGAIDRWVETGKAPERIVASKPSGGEKVLTHPLCAYPKVAKYKGTGSTDHAESFVCSK